jgi:heptosyltransferase III
MIQPRRALFIQLRRIGDNLMCTPSIRAFKKAYPDCRLDFLTEHPDVLKGNPYLTEIIDVDKHREFAPIYQYKLIKKIRDNRYDLVVDFLANPRSAWYSYLSGAETRLSYGFGHRKWAYNLVPAKSAEPTYAAIDKLNLLKAIGIHSDSASLDFIVSDNARIKAISLLQPDNNRPIISISPVSRREYRRWPLENFAKLGDIISQKIDCRIIVLAGPGEDDVATNVCKLMKSQSLVLKIENLDLLGAFFEKVSLHIGNDNGPKHIAVACGVPTIAIFGTDSPISWTYPDPHRHQYLSCAEYCVECKNASHHPGPECIKQIPVDAVWDKFNLMLTNLNLLSAARQQ